VTTQSRGALSSGWHHPASVAIGASAPPSIRITSVSPSSD
jgi:hypothetical protein